MKVSHGVPRGAKGEGKLGVGEKRIMLQRVALVIAVLGFGGCTPPDAQRPKVPGTPSFPARTFCKKPALVAVGEGIRFYLVVYGQFYTLSERQRSEVTAYWNEVVCGRQTPDGSCDKVDQVRSIARMQVCAADCADGEHGAVLAHAEYEPRGHALLLFGRDKIVLRPDEERRLLRLLSSIIGRDLEAEYGPRIPCGGPTVKEESK